NIVSVPGHVNLTSRPAPPSRPSDPVYPAGPYLAVEHGGLTGGHLTTVRRPLRAAGREKPRSEDAGRAGLAGPVDHRRGRCAPNRSGARGSLPRRARCPPQPPPPDGSRLSHYRTPHRAGRADESNAGLGDVRRRAGGAAADVEPGG